MTSAMRPEHYDEGYWEHGVGSNYKGYGDDPGWGATARIVAHFAPGAALLEVGCAKGFFVRAASFEGMAAEGIDLSHWAIEHPAPGISNWIRQGNATDLPWAADSFAVVCSWEMLEHVPEEEIDRVLAEMVRVAKSGALFVHRIGLEEDGDPSHQHDDVTHVLIRPREWWTAKFDALPLDHRPEVEDALDVAFTGRDWAGRFFAYEVD